jgi:hypothetical protein
MDEPWMPYFLQIMQKEKKHASAESTRLFTRLFIRVVCAIRFLLFIRQIRAIRVPLPSAQATQNPKPQNPKTTPP